MSLNISYFLCLWSKSPLNLVIQPLNSYLGAGMGFACTAMHVCSSPVVYRPPRLRPVAFYSAAATTKLFLPELKGETSFI